MLSHLTSYIPAIIILGALIFVHELGHFLVARWSGVCVEKFSIGFGPEIFRWTRNHTHYVVSIIPLGGFVKLAGESVDALEGRKPKEDDFITKSLLKRFLIVFAGPLMNLLTGFAILVVVFYVGRPLPSNIIGEFVKGYPAETSGLHVGDRITKINGKETPTWVQVTEGIVFNEGDHIELDIDRNGEALHFSVGTRVEEGVETLQKNKKIHRLGIKPDMREHTLQKYPLGQSFIQSAIACFEMVRMMGYTFYKLVTFQLSVQSLSGPVQIFSIAGETAKFGLIPLLDLAAFLSISLSVFNVLPIPVLDGGHLLFMFIEAIRKKPVSVHMQEKATIVGFVSLILLMLIVTYNDFSKIGVFEKIKNLFWHS